MKSETQNLKDGQWRVTPESIDDVWVLSSIIEAGDRCTAVTTRKIAVGESIRRNDFSIRAFASFVSDTSSVDTAPAIAARSQSSMP